MNMFTRGSIGVCISFIILICIYISTMISIQDIQTTTTMTTIITTSTSGKNLFGEEIVIKRSYVYQICGSHICPELADIVESFNHQVIISDPVVSKTINNIDVGKLNIDYIHNLNNNKDYNDFSENEYALATV